jgi:hypothetical protein
LLAQEDLVNSNKELKCIIHQWYIKDYPEIDLSKASFLRLAPNPEGCYVVCGYVTDHPTFGRDRLTTSQVLTPKKDIVEGAIIETLNSRYRLGEEFHDRNGNKTNRPVFD